MERTGLDGKPYAGNPHMRMVERMLVIFAVVLSGVSAARAETYTAGECDVALLVHRWSLNGDLADSVGGTTATVDGASSWNDASHPTAITLPGGNKGTGAVNLGTNMLPADGSPVTIEIWATQHEVLGYSRVFDIGNGTGNFLTLEWSYNGDGVKDVAEIRKSGILMSVTGMLGGFPLNIEWHISMTIVKRSDGKSDIRWMRRDASTGALIKAGSATTSKAWTLADVAADALWLGRSQFPDLDPHATYNEVRVWKALLSDTQLEWSARLGPDTLPTTAAGEETATVSATAGTGGKVSVNGTAAVSSGSVTMPKNELVTLVATADDYYEFRGWTGDIGMIHKGTVNDATIVVYAASAAAFTANFRPIATWTGLGENALWSTAGNWLNTIAPSEDDSLFFNGNTQVSNENDAVSALHKITFGAVAAAHTLVGRAVVLDGLVNESAAVQTIDLPVTAGNGVLAVSGAGTTVFNTALTAGGWTLSGGGALRLDGGVDAAGADLLATGDGTVSLKGSSEARTLYLNGRGEVDVEEEASFKLAGIVNQNGSTRLTVDGGTIAVNGTGETFPAFTTAANLVTGTKGLVFDTGDNMVKTSTAFTNDGASPFTKTGSGTLEMPIEPAGAVTVEEGKLVLMNPHLVHRWSFNGDLKDAVGGSTATVSGASSWNDANHPTAITLPGGGPGTGAINLGANMLPADGSPVTIEIWATQHEVCGYSRVFDIGSSKSNYLALEWSYNGIVEKDVAEVQKNDRLISVLGALGGFPLNTEWHISMTIVKRGDGKSDLRWMRRDAHTGALIAAGSATTSKAWTVADVAASALWLGHGQYGDDDPHATYNEVRVWDTFLTDEQLAASAMLGPDRLPDTEEASLAEDALCHRWSFNGNLVDSIGGTTATVSGASSWNDAGHPTAIALPGGAMGAGAVNLGANMLPSDGSPVTIEIWATQHEVRGYSRVFDIGSSKTNYLALEWSYNGDGVRDVAEIKKSSTLMSITGALGGFPLNTEWHISMTIVKRGDGKCDIRWMRRDARTGVLITAGSATTSSAWSVSDVAANALWLGHTQYTDDDPHATYNEVRVWKALLSDAQLSRNVRLGPDRLPSASASTFGSVAVAAGATLETKVAGITVGTFGGTGCVTGSGCLMVADTLSIGGADAATLTLDGHLAVAGTWLIAGRDTITGTGMLDISGATITLASDTRNSGRLVLATVGEVVGWDTVNIPRGRILEYADGTLVLRAQHTIIYIR